MTTKSQLIDAIAAETGVGKGSIARVLDAAFKAIASADKVTLTGFGTFQRKTRAARLGRNPRTGEVAEIAARNVLTFKASKPVK